MKMSSSELRSPFIYWHSLTKHDKTVCQCKSLMSTVESLNSVFGSSMLILF